MSAGKGPSPDQVAKLAAYGAEVEADHDLVIIEQLTDVPDGHGRTNFVMHWFGYHPATGHSHRAQVFHADLGWHVKQAYQRASTVRVDPPATPGQGTPT